MSWSSTPFRIQVGDDVYGSDGDNVGTAPELVSKEAFRQSEQVHGTVRREEVDLIDEGTATNQYAGGVTSPRRS